MSPALASIINCSLLNILVRRGSVSAPSIEPITDPVVIADSSRGDGLRSRYADIICTCMLLEDTPIVSPTTAFVTNTDQNGTIWSEDIQNVNSLSLTGAFSTRFWPLFPLFGRHPRLQLRHLAEPLLLQGKLFLELIVVRVVVVFYEDRERGPRGSLLRLPLDLLDLFRLLRGSLLSVHRRGSGPSSRSSNSLYF